jgi:histidinol dehydrogenase
LSVNDFVKLITVQKYDRQALGVLGPQAALLADAEGLDGHAAAIRARLKKPAASRGNTKARGGRAG